MVDAGVTVVLSKLQEVASAEVTALLKVDDQIRVLRRGLGYLQAQVRGADQQRRGRASELLLLWARETREVVFDVEDAVDEFHLKVEAFQVKVRSCRAWTTWWYHSAVNLLNGLAMQLFVRHGLSRDITKIEERIKEISQIKETYRIESSASELWSQSTIGVVWDIECSSTDLRKAEFEALKDEILHTDGSCTHRPVISILGTSGTGKTRLARKLYNDREVRGSFEVISWICLPPRVRFEQYVDMILEQVRPQVGGADTATRTGSITTTDADAAASSSAQTSTSGEKLNEVLKGRRYLVVLDGLVDPAGNWNSLLALLPGDRANRESRVLITAQLSAKEMKHADPKTKPTVLEPIEPGQTDELFRDRVRGGGLLQQQAASGLQEISMRVHGICRGLPLAVIVLGGILRTKAYPSEWKEVLSQKLETPTGEARAMRCLWLLAFEQLPNHLKSCFLYLATAPENALLGAARMVRLWIAEGFVAPSKGRTLEEVGMGYLRELVSRGLVELVERDANARSGGGISKVAVHGLLHAFVQAEAQESGFLEIHHRASVLSPHAVRRLAIHNFADAYVDIPDRFPKLRSLLCDFLEEEQDKSSGSRSHHRRSSGSATHLHHQQLHSRCAEWLLRACGGGGSVDGGMNKKVLHQLSVVRGSRFLRVIDLHGVMLARVPDEIGGSVHLRYLGITSCRLRQLPASISRLHNLQTLDVRGTLVESVADGFWDLAALRHVLAAGALLLPAKCSSACQLMKHLQTLDGVAAAGCCCPLNRMIYLRSLRLCSIPESPEFAAALLSALEKMEFLVNLSLSGGLVPSGIFSNPSSRSLEALALDGRMDSPPSGSFFLPNLGKLTLSRSGPRNLTQDFIDKVAGLPNLCEMDLLDGSYGDAQELVFRKGGFPSLTKLKLNNLVDLEKMELAHGSAPELAIVTTSGCTKMKLYDNRRTSSLEGENDGEDASGIEISPEAAGWMITQRGPVPDESKMMETGGVEEEMKERSAKSRLDEVMRMMERRLDEEMMETSATSSCVKELTIETSARSGVTDVMLERSSCMMERSSFLDRMKYAIHDYCAAIQYMDG